MSSGQVISLHLALPTDALTLAEVHNDAFANDVFMELMYGPLADNLVPLAQDLEQLMRGNPHSRFLKAVDDESGRILGWSWWCLYHDAEAHIKARQEAAKKSTTLPPNSISPEAYVDSRRIVLARREKWVGGAVAILQVLMVRPDCQGRGVGSQLLMAGVDEAKRLDLPAWLEASAAGYQLYQKCGFRDVGEGLDFDLTQYGAVGYRRGFSKAHTKVCLASYINLHNTTLHANSKQNLNMIPTQSPPPPVGRITPDGFERLPIELSPETLARLMPPRPLPLTLRRPYHDIPVVDGYDLEFSRPKPAYVTSYESACQHGPFSTVESIIQTQRRTPAFLHHGLLLTLQTGNIEMTRYLLAAGAPITKDTPFQVVRSAPQHQQIPLLELFHDYGWTPNTADDNGDFLLPHVVTNLPLLRWFLSHGADPNLGRPRPDRNRAGDCNNSCDALERAAAYADVEAVRLLLDAGAKIQNGFPLHHAAGIYPVHSFRYYKTVVPSTDFDIARIPVMELLVERGADINQYFESWHMEPRYAIVQSVLAGAVERTRWLLQHGADPEIGGVANALGPASAVGSDEMKQVFEEAGYTLPPKTSVQTRW